MQAVFGTTHLAGDPDVLINPTLQATTVWSASAVPDSHKAALDPQALHTFVAAHNLYPSMHVLHAPAPSPSSHPLDSTQDPSSLATKPALHVAHVAASVHVPQFNEAAQASHVPLLLKNPAEH